MEFLFGTGATLEVVPELDRSLREGTTENVCVNLTSTSGGLEREIVVAVTTSDETAMSKQDIHIINRGDWVGLLIN